MIHILASAIVIFLAIGLHEYSHCKVADLSGDPTPRMMGRVTLNLTKHFELTGTIMMIITSIAGVGIGWGKPAPINPSKMRNPRWDTLATVIAGPLSNIAQATIYAVIIRVFLMTGILDPHTLMSSIGRGATNFIPAFLVLGLFINVSLAVFNMLPIGPLDGHWIVGLLLPPKAQAGWFQFQRQYGWPILLGLIIFGNFSNSDILGQIMEGPMTAIIRLLLGV